MTNTTSCLGSGCCLLSHVVAYPTLNFTVVVNPASGPGNTTCPDANYVAAIAQLNKYPNIRKIGYIASNQGSRPVPEYQAEIDKYFGWSSCTPSIPMNGIFVDEVNNVDTSASKQSYYQTLTDYVRTKMLPGNRYVTLNAGAPMPLSYFNFADSIITYEGYYAHMYDAGTIFNDTNKISAGTPRQKQAALIHEFTGDAATQQQVSDDMGETQAMGLLYITDAKYIPNPYDRFPTMWQQFVDAVNATDTWMAQHPSFFP